jgi:hypothetical protein
MRSLWVVSPTKRPARRVTFDNESVVDPVWSADGKLIYYASDRDGPMALWRVAAFGTGTPERVNPWSGGIARQPSIGWGGGTLAYSAGPVNLDLVFSRATDPRMPYGTARMG